MNDENIYQPPKSDLYSDDEAQDLPVASRGQRFANQLIDYVFFFIFALICGFVLGATGLLDSYLDGEPNLGMDYLLGFIIMFLYYVPQEALWGKTIAKRMTKTAVVTTDGELISWGHAIIRTLSRFLPFEAFSFFGNQGGAGKPIGWHDSIAKTKVISFK
jgi:Predicted membrane protein/domain